MTVAAIILSGGENRRMGRNKAFLMLQGRMFLWIIIGALTPLFRDLILVTREPDLYAGFPVRRVADLFPERGPLTGIISGLAASPDSTNFCVGCDMPLVQASLVQYMVAMAGEADAVIPRVRDPEKGGVVRIEPLHAVYHKRCLPLMKHRLREGRRSLHELVSSLNVKYLGERDLARFDPEFNSFRNINTPEAYRAVLAERSASG
jgi:molybdopterin-guanine dinucleotide biosynthesis protein A